MANKTNKDRQDEPGGRAQVGRHLPRIIAVDAEARLRASAPSAWRSSSATVASCCSPSREGLGRPRDRGRDRRRQRGADAVAAARRLQPDDPARGCTPRHELRRAARAACGRASAGAEAAGAEGGRGRGQGQLPKKNHIRRWARGVARQRPGHGAPGGRGRGRALNRDYRGKDYATNVLTFAYAEGEDAAGLPAAAADACRLAGDLVLCVPVVVREAAAGARPWRRTSPTSSCMACCTCGLRSRRTRPRRPRWGAGDRDPASASSATPTLRLERLSGTPTPKWTVPQTARCSSDFRPSLARTGRSR